MEFSLYRSTANHLLDKSALTHCAWSDTHYYNSVAVIGTTDFMYTFFITAFMEANSIEV